LPLGFDWQFCVANYPNHQYLFTMIANSQQPVVNSQAGFTLIELSIVLVIIGLLIGGILVAQGLIESVKINGLIRQIGQYQILVGQFEQRFNQLPGDIPNAQALFGAGTGSGGQTCNGNGDGKLQNTHTLGTSGCAGNNNHREPYYFAEHLYLSGLLKEAYVAGNSTDSYLNFDFDKNFYGSPSYGSRLITGRGNDNHMILHSQSVTQGATLTSLQSMTLDKKIDDGRAGRGEITARDGRIANGPNSAATNGICTNPRSWGGFMANWGQYVLDSEGNACSLYFPIVGHSY